MKILLAVATLGCALAQTPDVGQIMARVGENQSKALAARKDWVYHQKQLLRMVRGIGKLAREERREYVMTPQDTGVHKDLAHFEGKYERHGKYIAYDHPNYEYKEMDIDGELIDDMSNDMTDDRKSRDGIAHDLFPLAATQQARYDFTLKGSEIYHGRPVFRVAFQPKPHQQAGDGDADWKGDALIDAEEFQPVVINTRLAAHIPMAVRILLGTNIKGLGFSVSYQKFADGVWFPVSYGGEFEVRAVFFYKRAISVSLVNSDFRRTDVTSKVAYALEEK